mgnify:CR=1 FL=1
MFVVLLHFVTANRKVGCTAVVVVRSAVVSFAQQNAVHCKGLSAWEQSPSGLLLNRMPK